MVLKSLSIEKLFDLKSKVEAMLASKLADERRDLETKLSRLVGVQPDKSARKARGRGPWGPVAPKYRNPKNPAETWAGRGLKPRWLVAAMKSGKTLEDFAIPATAAAAKKRKIARKSVR
jgi:DNA-binding protein H-NS